MANLGQPKSTTLPGEDCGSVAKFGACGGCLLCGNPKSTAGSLRSGLQGACRHISTVKLGAGGKSFGVRNGEDEGLLGDLKHFKR